MAQSDPLLPSASNLFCVARFLIRSPRRQKRSQRKRTITFGASAENRIKDGGLYEANANLGRLSPHNAARAFQVISIDEKRKFVGDADDAWDL
jgi:hypothetical protein